MFCEEIADRPGPAQKYRHCHLVRDVGDGVAHETMSWLPSRFAIKGQMLRLMIDGRWIPDWIVTYVGQEISEVELDRLGAVAHQAEKRLKGK